MVNVFVGCTMSPVCEGFSHNSFDVQQVWVRTADHTCILLKGLVITHLIENSNMNKQGAVLFPKVDFFGFKKLLKDSCMSVYSKRRERRLQIYKYLTLHHRKDVCAELPPPTIGSILCTGYHHSPFLFFSIVFTRKQCAIFYNDQSHSTMDGMTGLLGSKNVAHMVTTCVEHEIHGSYALTSISRDSSISFCDLSSN